MTQLPDPAFAAREAALSTREADIAAREAKIARADHASFAEKLVQDGKLLPASKDKIVALLDVLPGHAAVSFAGAAEKLTPGAALRDILEAQPKMVSFGALDLPAGGGDASTVAFATLPGQQMIYLAKEAEARAFLTDPAPDLANYPLLSAEIGITAPDALQLAQVWLNMGDLWRSTAAGLEALRLGAAAAVEAAGTVAEVEASVARFWAY